MKAEIYKFSALYGVCEAW